MTRANPSANVRVRAVSWDAGREPLSNLRRGVFVEEQKVPEELEWDGEDANCLHFLAEAGDEPVGTARLTPDGQVGRMAVLPGWRGQGIGRALMGAILEAARERGHAALYLNAQVHAEAFYAAFGFVAEGGVFDDAGIPHRRMTRTLD